MPAYQYIALDPAGRRTKGVVEGDSGRGVRQTLRDRGLAPIEVSAAREESTAEKRTTVWFQRISPLNLALCTRQLATLINAGIPIEESLRIVAEQSGKHRISTIFMSVRSRVLEGHSLSDAMTDFPRTFSTMYRSTIAAGEQSGYLDEVLNGLAIYVEERFESRRDVEMAMYYPILLFACALIIVGLLLTYVVPDIVEVFDDSGAELPPVTLFLITASEFLRNYFWLLVIASLVAVLAIRWILTVSAVRLLWDRIKLNVPFFGGIVMGMNTARYASTLSVLGNSGVPLVDAMRIASTVTTNELLRGNLNAAADSVSEGTSLRAALTEIDRFPKMFLHMVASGEASGELNPMLSKVASFQQQELKRVIETLIQLFRPIMLLFMAGLVLFIMLAILLPILNMNQLVLQ